MEVDSHLVHPLMRSFMYGQFANLFKFALWWVTLAPLTYALLDGSTTAIGVGRIVYNCALCITSPIGGLIIERAHPKSILKRAAGVRFIIWSVLIPLTWFLFQSSIVTTSQAAVYIILNVCLFFDGIAVGLSTVLDIDLCGVDVIANTYGLDVTDEHRNQFNSRQEFFFAVCFVVFAPGMAFLGLAIHRAFDEVPGRISGMALESGTLTAIFFATFLVATVLQFFFFSQLPNDRGEVEKGGGNGVAPGSIETSPLEGQGISAPPGGAQSGGGGPSEEEAPQPPPTFFDQIKTVPADLKGSLEVIWHNPPVLWRLVFLGFEIAFEDAAIVVIASQMGILLPWLGDGNSVTGNIWTSVAVACGKLGGAIASVIMMKCYTPPENPKKFIPIFALITFSCCFIFLFPAVTDLYEQSLISANVARTIFLLAFFCYFFVSTLPKLGLMCLFQSMVAQIENGPRVFGFVAIIATSFDALVIMVLSALFVKYDIQKALWITALVYMGHGLLELVVGPLLVVGPMAKHSEGAEGEAKEARGTITPSHGSESASLIGNVQNTPERGGSHAIPIGGSSGVAHDAAGDADPNQHLAATGTFTQRSAAVAMAATPRSGTTNYGGIYTGAGSFVGGSSLRRGGPQAQPGEAATLTAVMSTSMHGAHFATVQRRRSNLDADLSASPARYTRQGSALTPHSQSLH